MIIHEQENNNYSNLAMITARLYTRFDGTEQEDNQDTNSFFLKTKYSVVARAWSGSRLQFLVFSCRSICWSAHGPFTTQTSKEEAKKAATGPRSTAVAGSHSLPEVRSLFLPVCARCLVVSSASLKL